MLIAPNVPKPAPWTINELDPRHHFNPAFDNMTPEQQEDQLFGREYLPFDFDGHPILLRYDKAQGKYVHIHPGQPDYEDPIQDSVRTDSKEHRTPVTNTGKYLKNSVPPPPQVEERARQPSARSLSGAGAAGRGSTTHEAAQRARREKDRNDKELTAIQQLEKERRQEGQRARRAKEREQEAAGAAAGDMDVDEQEPKEEGAVKIEADKEEEAAGSGSAKRSGGGFTAANR